MNWLRRIVGCLRWIFVGPPKPKHTAKVLTFQDDAGKWRWHAIADNGRLVATSGQPFDGAYEARRAGVQITETKFTIGK